MWMRALYFCLGGHNRWSIVELQSHKKKKPMKRHKSESLVQNLCFGGLFTDILIVWVLKSTVPTAEELALEMPL